PIVANRVLSAVRKMCNWALERDMLSVSPCAGVKPPSKERKRDRVLKDHPELHDVWVAADQLGFPFGPLTKLLILTAQRRDEVRGMRWSEINATGDLWTLPAGRVKNARGHTVPLSGAAREILASLPRFAGPDFVFTTNGTTPVSGFAKIKG